MCVYYKLSLIILVLPNILLLYPSNSSQNVTVTVLDVSIFWTQAGLSPVNAYSKQNVSPSFSF